MSDSTPGEARGGAAEDGARRSGSFVGNVNVVMLTYAADGLLALATGALVARGLGTEGRGAYALFVVSAAFGQLLLGLGAGNAAIYYLNKREIPLRDVVSAAHVIVLWSIAVTGVAVAIIAPIAGGRIFGDVIPAWLLLLAVPSLVWMNLLRLVLQALNRFVDLGIATVGQQAVLLALVAIAYAGGDMTATQVVAFLVAASLGAALFSLLRVGVRNVDVAQIVRPQWGTLRSLVGFGAKGELGNVLQLLNYRLDQYILNRFASLAAVGVYAVGASMTESVFILANAVALVLMPRLTSANPDEAAWMAPVACRNTMLIGAAGSLVLAAIAPVFIPAIFGDAYRDSVQALWLLLPGTVALTGSKVLTSYIFSQGLPLVNTGITGVSLVVTLIADFALIPAFGVNGAAGASSIAYAAHFAAALVAYRVISGQPALGAVLPRPRDAGLYVDAIQGIFARMSGRTPAGAGS
jgi:O-antigen/teichoic acid export membrane protein